MEGRETASKSRYRGNFGRRCEATKSERTSNDVCFKELAPAKAFRSTFSTSEFWQFVIIIEDETWLECSSLGTADNL